MDFIFYKQQFDTSIAAGELTLTVLAAIAAIHRAPTGDYTSSSSDGKTIRGTANRIGTTQYVSIYLSERRLKNWQ